MSKPYISYIDPKTMKDAAMLAELERCRTYGTPRPESQAIRAHVPAVFWSFAQFLARRVPHRRRRPRHQGAVPALRVALGAVRVLRQPALDQGRQRRRGDRGSRQGPDQLRSSTRYDDKQKAALSYAEAITWDLPVDEKFWARLHKHFSEPELVEIGYFIALTMGQQRWLRTLNIEHHQILPGIDGSMAPGFETEEALKKSKAQADYWAKSAPKPQTAAAE